MLLLLKRLALVALTSFQVIDDQPFLVDHTGKPGTHVKPMLPKVIVWWTVNRLLGNEKSPSFPPFARSTP